MRNIKLEIQFDGTDYHGWQIQKQDRTVQKTVQDCVSKIVNSEVKLHGSGRTDAGVHALGQVANFSSDTLIDLDSLKKGLNSLLPGDIIISSVAECDQAFHSRYSAKSRTYWYFVWNFTEPSPFYSRYSWHIYKPLDLNVMKHAAVSLIGVHDFSSFQGADKEEVKPIREVQKIRFKKVGKHILLFEIKANAFLKHMVRNIMGSLVDIGKGKHSSPWLFEVLEKKDRTFAAATAPAQGLFLKKVEY
jgi:tRNA pseudouridine38-40 synthase